MQSLSDTEWDIVISGTGLQQSLLALALSRSNKKVLHVDRNDYYGGAEAAFSLQEVEEWVAKVNAGDVHESFLNATITNLTNDDAEEGKPDKLSFSRAYTLALSPQIIYSGSKLLSQLVSSKVYRQLEFQAVGNWWVYHPPSDDNTTGSEGPGRVTRIPNGREDVFADDSIDNRAKRNLMKFLRFAVDYENQVDIWQSYSRAPLPTFLSAVYNLPPSLQTAIMALTLSLTLPSETTVQYSLPRIARHLTSMGVFGPGFAAVIPKWGGSSEIVQVACRAGAVGGGVYLLGKGVKSKSLSDSTLEVTLTNNEVVRTKALVNSRDSDSQVSPGPDNTFSKMIAIVSSDLASLFTATVEGGPISAVSIVAFPPLSVKVDNQPQPEPVYVMAHSNDTGECPVGQCVLYASSPATGEAKARLEAAVYALLNCYPFESSREVGEPPKNQKFPAVLYSVYYEVKSGPSNNTQQDAILGLAGSSVDLAFDDEMLETVEDAWRIVMELTRDDQISQADASAAYLRFEDREHVAEEEDYDGA